MGARQTKDTERDVLTTISLVSKSIIYTKIIRGQNKWLLLAAMLTKFIMDSYSICAQESMDWVVDRYPKAFAEPMNYVT